MSKRRNRRASWTQMTAFALAVAMADLGVNGPEDARLDWDAIDWRAQEETVRRLRQRIFKATRDGDLKKVRNLQKLMLRSRANTLVSVRQATQRNAGRKTAGIDGEVALTSLARAELATTLHESSKPWQARPVKRVWIPKANGKLRGLGIPVIADRAQQGRVRNALEPEWEARFVVSTNAGGRPMRLMAGLLACGAVRGDGGGLVLRCRPAGGGIKPPRGALAEDCRAKRRGKRRGDDRVRCGSGR